MSTDLIAGQVCDFRVNIKREILDDEINRFISINSKFINLGRNKKYIKYYSDSSYLEITDYLIKREIEYKDGDEKKSRIETRYNIIILLSDTVDVGLRILNSSTWSEKSILRISGYNLKSSVSANSEEMKIQVCDEFLKQFLIPFEEFLNRKYGNIKFEWGYLF